MSVIKIDYVAFGKLIGCIREIHPGIGYVNAWSKIGGAAGLDLNTVFLRKASQTDVVVAVYLYLCKNGCNSKNTDHGQNCFLRLHNIVFIRLKYWLSGKAQAVFLSLLR